MVWDYIIVGAGSAGAAIAARLSEQNRHKVLLLESGPDYRSCESPAEMRSPNPFNILMPEDQQLLSRYHWTGIVSRRTEAQQFRPLKRGRGVGGSSAINGQTAIRGVLESFDRWAEMGCKGWSGREVLPFFCKLEDDVDYGDEPYHGKGGPIPVFRTPESEWGPVDLALKRAAIALGYPWANDHNSPGSTGVANYAINIRNGVRVSTNDGYLEPARSRSNLEIIGNAHAERIVFEDTRATGVVVNHNGQKRTFKGGQIVVSCGAVHSPALLMRSGVGNAEYLQQRGIDVVSNIPGVGENLFDHPVVRIEFDLKEQARINDPNFRHTNCCVRYSSGLAGGGFNDVNIFSINHGGFNEQALKSHGNGGFFVTLFEAFSRGRLRLKSVDPMDDPILEPRMLSDERDLIRMRDGARRLFKLGEHKAVSDIADRVTVGMTGIEIGLFDRASDQTVDSWMLSEAADCSHSAGTCRMGAVGDPRTVVDPDCRVVGLENLRVADASIMPEDCRANLHLTVVMIGEYLAHKLKTVN